MMTIWIMVAVGVFLIIYDVVAYKLWGASATISHTTMAISKEWPVIPLLFGILIGHLFWPQA